MELKGDWCWAQEEEVVEEQGFEIPSRISIVGDIENCQPYDHYSSLDFGDETYFSDDLLSLIMRASEIIPFEELLDIIQSMKNSEDDHQDLDYSSDDTDYSSDESDYSSEDSEYSPDSSNASSDIDLYLERLPNEME